MRTKILAIILFFSIGLPPNLEGLAVRICLAPPSAAQKMSPQEPSKEGITRREFFSAAAKAAAVVAAFWAAFTEPGCSERSHRRYPIFIPNPTLMSIETHADWILNQISAAQGTLIDGLAKSFENPSDPFAHTFNQAQAVMALLVAHAKFPNNGYNAAARNILTALQARQNTDGSFFAGFHNSDPAQNLWGKQPGAIAFVGLAINLYTLKTGDQQFVPMGESIADYLVSIAVSRPAFPGRALPNEDQKALSGEENLAAYGFLKEFSAITTDVARATTYGLLADDIRLFLESLWNDAEGRFNQGRNSGGVVNGNYNTLGTGYAADVQTAGVLALGNSSSNGAYDFTRALDPQATNSVKRTLEITTPPVGIAFTLADKTIDPTNFDAAQTARYAAALVEAGKNAANLAASFFNEANAELSHAEAIAVTSSGVNPVTGTAGLTPGGVLLTSRASGPITPAWRYQAVPSVEATSEAILAKAGVNFYRASIGSRQFFMLDANLQAILSSVLKGKKLVPGSYINWSVSAFLGTFDIYQGMDLNHDVITAIQNLLRTELTPKQKKDWYPDNEDLQTIVIHHEGIVHSNVAKIFLYYELDGSLAIRIKKFLEDLYEFRKNFRHTFRNRAHSATWREDTKDNSNYSFINELLTWLIGYYTYPQSARLQFNFKDKEAIHKIRKLAEKHFPALKPLFEQKVLGDTPEKRRLHVYSLLLTDFIPTHAVDAAL